MFIASPVESGNGARGIAAPPFIGGRAAVDQAVIDPAVGQIQAAIDALNHARDLRSASHSVLRAAANGAFAFIAGRTAGKRLPAGEPVEGARGRTRGGGMGLLSLTALTFSVMKEAEAADANVTILDEDSIAFKHMPHGTFELVTKEPVPRYIIVEDPGETIVVSRSGSTISVSQSANSAARMEELEAAQQEVYANLAKGLGPGGSGTTPFSDRLPVQPINFVEPDDPATLNSLPALPAVETKTEFIFIPFREPAPPAPTLTLALGSGLTETDTVIFDTFTATSGIFSASSSNAGAPLTYGISGGTPGNTVLNGVAYDVSQPGDYGTLYVNSATGAYTFVPDDAAINALKTPTTEDFVVTVSDGALSASQTFTVGIDGVNDDAVIAGDVTGSLSEASGIASVASFARFAAAHAPAPRVASGTLTSTDVDDPSNAFTAVSSPTASDGGYGTFTMTADGEWTYTLDDGNSAVQALNVDDTLVDTFTVTTIDGTEQVVTIVIGGRNDPAVISGDTAGSVVEAACKDPGIPVATGTLSATDVDNPSTTFTPVECGKSDGGYGTFTMTADGVWTYTLDNDNCVVQSLGDCDTLTDTFTVTTEDGTEQVVTITIQGADDRRKYDGHFDEDRSYEATASISSEEETASGHDSVEGEETAGIAAKEAEPVVVHESSAAVESSPAAPPDGGESFQFKDQSSETSDSNAVVLADGGCVQALISSFVSANGLPHFMEAVQAFEFCLPEHVSDSVNVVPDQKAVSYHFSHDLVV